MFKRISRCFHESSQSSRVDTYEYPFLQGASQNTGWRRNTNIFWLSSKIIYWNVLLVLEQLLLAYMSLTSVRQCKTCIESHGIILRMWDYVQM